MPTNSIESEWSEILLLADMVERLSSSDRGLQVSQGASIATRLRSCRDRLRSSFSTIAERGRLDSPPALAASQVHDGPLPPLTKLTGASVSAAKASVSPRVPAPPAQPAAVVRSSSEAAGVGCASVNENSPLAHRRQQPHFQVKKPSSVRVAQVARDAAPVSAAAASREIARNISIAIYNVLESVANLTHAASAHLYLRIGDEMVSITNVSQKLNFPPKLVRQGCQGSIAAGVMASGIAVNQRHLEPGRQLASALVFPLRSTFNTLGEHSASIGAIQLSNKGGGGGNTCGFTEVDENVANIASVLIGEMLGKFPGVDWTEFFYDPITQHMVAPFVPRGQSTARLVDDEATVFITAADALTRKPLVEAVDSFVPPQLIRRVTLPLTSAAPTASLITGLGAAPSLREVDTYLSNLHDCWRKSVELNVQQSHSERSKTKEMKALREDLNVHRAKCAKIEEELRLHTLDSNDYHREYSSLKQELDAYLRAKGRLD